MMFRVVVITLLMQGIMTGGPFPDGENIMIVLLKK
jgi:hypothetical protein